MSTKEWIVTLIFAMIVGAFISAYRHTITLGELKECQEEVSTFQSYKDSMEGSR